MPVTPELLVLVLSPVFRSVAAETCEELFTANAPRIALALKGIEIFTNASGSHHQLRKLNLRMDAIKNATRFCGGVYMYSNHQGCDGGRLYYGVSFIFSLNLVIVSLVLHWSCSTGYGGFEYLWNIVIIFNLILASTFAFCALCQLGI